jgi:hypothetical protein
MRDVSDPRLPARAWQWLSAGLGAKGAGMTGPFTQAANRAVTGGSGPPCSLIRRISEGEVSGRARAPTCLTHAGIER